MVAEQYFHAFVRFIREQDDNDGWLNLFTTITQKSDYNIERLNQTVHTARSPRNAGRNRYLNVSPYDENLLRITPTNFNPDGFINASPVKVTEAKRSYILCQGPLEHTSVDFWQMVWEKNVPCIVMLNKLFEGGKAKCHNYFPSKESGITEQIYGSFKVKLFDENIKEMLVYRMFELTRTTADGEETRKVRHVQFVDWPDFGVPPSTGCFSMMHDFVIGLNVLTTELEQPPVIVHCSAGIGRSGSFVFVDSILRMVELNVNWTTTVTQFVVELRKSRYGLIQTPSQLKYACKVVMNALEDKYRLRREAVPDEVPAENEPEPNVELPEAPGVPVIPANPEVPIDPQQVAQVGAADAEPADAEAPVADRQEEPEGAPGRIVANDEKRGTKRTSSSGSEERDQEKPAAEQEKEQADGSKTKRREMISRMVEKSRAANSRRAHIYNLVEQNWKMTCSVGALVAAVAVGYYFTRS